MEENFKFAPVKQGMTKENYRDSLENNVATALQIIKKELSSQPFSLPEFQDALKKHEGKFSDVYIERTLINRLLYLREIDPAGPDSIRAPRKGQKLFKLKI